jgi:hypothetical protein
MKEKISGSPEAVIQAVYDKLQKQIEDLQVHVWALDCLLQPTVRILQADGSLSEQWREMVCAMISDFREKADKTSDQLDGKKLVALAEKLEKYLSLNDQNDVIRSFTVIPGGISDD